MILTAIVNYRKFRNIQLQITIRKRKKKILPCPKREKKTHVLSEARG
jgi:hypothetical protein